MVSSRARPWLKWALLLGAALPGRAQDLLSVGNPSQPPPASWTAGAYAFACSDPIPLHGFFNHWQGGFTPGRDPVTYGCWGMETRASAGPWSLSVWDRTTFLARMSPDGARLIWLAKQKLTYPQGEIFNLHLDLGALHRDGVSLGRALRLGDLALGASLGFWTATNAQLVTDFIDKLDEQKMGGLKC